MALFIRRRPAGEIGWRYSLENKIVISQKEKEKRQKYKAKVKSES